MLLNLVVWKLKKKKKGRGKKPNPLPQKAKKVIKQPDMKTKSMIFF